MSKQLTYNGFIPKGETLKGNEKRIYSDVADIVRNRLNEDVIYGFPVTPVKCVIKISIKRMNQLNAGRKR